MEEVNTVFIVGISNAAENRMVSPHRTYEGALKAWHEVRLRLIWKAAEMVEVLRAEDPNDTADIWLETIENLQCEDPSAIDNDVLDCPYIAEYRLMD